MAFGVTSEGFTRKPFTTIQAEMQAYVRAKISKSLQLTEKTGLGNVLNSSADQLSELWEAVEACYHSADKDNALDDAFVALCELTGTKRRGATKGVVSTYCTFTGGTTYPAGSLVAHLDGFPDNRWVNRNEVVTTTAGSYGVSFEAETTGARTALTGTLIRIAQPVNGWTSVYNTADATPGQNIESIEDLYVRREQELQDRGTAQMASIRSAVSRVAGVVQVKSQENKTDYPASGIPPHSFRVIVWDGSSPAANNNQIAQAIYDNCSGGIPSIGAYTGTAIDADGSAVTVKFDRPVGVPIYIVVDVDGSTAGVTAAILAEAGKLGIGSAVVREKLKAAVGVLAGVTDVPTFTLGVAPAPVGTSNLVMTIDQIPLFDASRITVT